MYTFPGSVAVDGVFRNDLAGGKHVNDFIAFKAQELVRDLVGLQMAAFNQVHDLFLGYGQNLRGFTDSDKLTAHDLTLPEAAH